MKEIRNVDNIINKTVDYPHAGNTTNNTKIQFKCTSVVRANERYRFEFCVQIYDPHNMNHLVLTWFEVFMTSSSLGDDKVSIILFNDYDKDTFSRFFKANASAPSLTTFSRHISKEDIKTPIGFMASVLNLFTDYHGGTPYLIEQF